MGNWFECKVKHKRTLDNGKIKPITDSYLVDALSFTEAEARITEEVRPFVSDDFTISAVKRTKISEIFWDDSVDKWYLVKVAFTIIDEKSAVEKKAISQILVAGSDFKNSYDHFMAGMAGSAADFEIQSITETPIMDVYKLKPMATRTRVEPAAAPAPAETPTETAEAETAPAEVPEQA